VAQSNNGIRPSAGNEREFGTLPVSSRMLLFEKSKKSRQPSRKLVSLGIHTHNRHRAPRHQREIGSVDAPGVTATTQACKRLCLRRRFAVRPLFDAVEEKVVVIFVLLPCGWTLGSCSSIRWTCVGVLNRSEKWRPCCCEKASASVSGKVLTPLRCTEVRKMINGFRNQDRRFAGDLQRS